MPRAVVDTTVLVSAFLTEQGAIHDRGTKLPDYRAIPSVRAILLVSSTERRVELWRRDGPRWIVENFIGDAELRLDVIDVALRRWWCDECCLSQLANPSRNLLAETIGGIVRDKRLLRW